MELSQEHMQSIRQLVGCVKKIKSGKSPTRAQIALLEKLDGKHGDVPKKSPGEVSIEDIRIRAGCDRATVEKWIHLEGIQPVRTRTLKNRMVRYYDEKTVLPIILSHCDQVAKKYANGQSAEANIDPETKLTWAQAEIKEKTLEKRHTNEIAENVKNQTWMETATHHKILSAVINRIEQIPGKAKSQLGLTAQQAIELRRMLDECRESAAQDIEKGEE